MKLLKRQNIPVFLATVSLVSGLTLYVGLSVVPYLATHMGPRSKPTKALANLPTAPTPDPTAPPTAVNIPEIGKNLTVKPAAVHGNTWGMFDDAVAWLATSATPGTGNVILYAHDRTNLWRDLYVLKNGDTVQILQAGIWRNYKVTGSKAISPHDIPAILSKNNQLTMYTCEGSFDQKRRVVYAAPVD